MHKIIKLAYLLLITVCLVASGCSSSRKGQCGCPNKQGMVGYK